MGQVNRRLDSLVRTLAILALLLAVLCLHPRRLQAASEQDLEYQVKAAFLLNFTKFIEWPPAAFTDSNSPFTVCIMGTDPFGRSLEQIVEGETVNSRKLIVQRIIQGPPPKSCQVLFAGKAERDVSKILSGLGPGVLSVGEGPGFLRDGGMIAFVLENRRVRFDINQTVAENASLNFSSKLLSVARSVEK
jgi:YfiR/HmsC-like